MGQISMSTNNFLAILPQIALLLLVGIILIIDIFSKKSKNKNLLGWSVSIGLIFIIIIMILFTYPGGEPKSAWGGMLRVDSASFIFQIIILIGAFITTLFSMNHKQYGSRGEYYAMLLISVIGMNFMVASTDLIMLYLAIETTAIPLYILSGFITNDNKSVESGLKYLLFGAVTSAVMLYGFSLLYGFSGETQFGNLIIAIEKGMIPNGLKLVILFMVLAGFGFKVSSVPFHFWAPDVYEGSPTPISGFLSTASKAAGFIVLIRFLSSVYSFDQQSWMLLVAMLATVSMFLGNLLALVQKNMKRLLAFSSIGHAGYILIGVASGNQLGIKGAMYYLLAYLFTNLAAFGVIHIVEMKTGSSEIEQFRGLIKKSPGLALIFLVALLSLAGIPPFGGFISKILVFSAAVQANLIWLALVGIINSIIGLYYYLIVIKSTFSDSDDTESIPIYLSWKIALGICVVGIIVLGIFFNPWMKWMSEASINMMLLYFY
jgi:NADH-quinone oxidoreductase subunit N